LQRRELKKRLGEQSASPSRSRLAYLSYQSDLHLFPPIRKLHNAADFVSVAWRSRKVFQRVYARVQRELGRASASLDIKETLQRRLLIVFVSSRLFICLLLFIRLPLTRCLPVVSPAFRFMPRFAKFFSHPFSASFPVKFFGFIICEVIKSSFRYYLSYIYFLLVIFNAEFFSVFVNWLFRHTVEKFVLNLTDITCPKRSI